MSAKKKPPKMGARRLSELPAVDPDKEAMLLGQPALGEPKPVVRQERKEVRWDDANQRLTFYIPKVVLSALKNEVSKSRKSQTAIIVEALRNHLGV